MSLVNASRSELTKQFTTAIWWILGLVLLVGASVALAASSSWQRGHTPR